MRARILIFSALSLILILAMTVDASALMKATGAGTTCVNTDYFEAGTTDGVSYYQAATCGTTVYLYRFASRFWAIGDTLASTGNDTQYYYTVSATDTPAGVTFSQNGKLGTSPKPTISQETAVELLYFEAIPGTDSVNLRWETASEIDTIGYNLWRSSEEDGPYEQINDVRIPSVGGPEQGASYEYADMDCPGLCFYELEDIDAAVVSTFHGPVSADAAPRVCGTSVASRGINHTVWFLTPLGVVLGMARRVRTRQFAASRLSLRECRAQ